MIPYVHYKTATGRIVMAGTVPLLELVEQQQPLRDGCAVLAGEGHWDTHYVSDGQIAPRPACPAVLQGQQITGIPLPATLTIDGAAYAVEAPTVALDLSYPGTIYRLCLQAWPYLDADWEVTA
jgi:hypothetical protein